MVEKQSMAQSQQYHTQSNGVIITPLHDELPASVPAGYPTAGRSNNGGANAAGLSDFSSLYNTYPAQLQ